MLNKIWDENEIFSIRTSWFVALLEGAANVCLSARHILFWQWNSALHLAYALHNY